MADAISTVEDLVHGIERLPMSRVTVSQSDPWVWVLDVQFTHYDDAAWDSVIEQVDHVRREVFGEYSLDLRMTLAS